LTFLRQTKGQKIKAACGQLGNLALRKRLWTETKKLVTMENQRKGD